MLIIYNKYSLRKFKYEKKLRKEEKYHVKYHHLKTLLFSSKFYLCLNILKSKIMMYSNILVLFLIN